MVFRYFIDTAAKNFKRRIILIERRKNSAYNGINRTYVL